MHETMPKPSPYPNHPVRVLRDHLGFSSAQAFAKFVGLPAETIRNLEQGRRAVTDRVASQIGIATLVTPDWLKVGNVARGQPVDVMGEPVDRGYLSAYDTRALMASSDEVPEIVESGVDSVRIWVTALVQAAARRGRLRGCWHFIILACRDAAIQFDIEDLVREEMIKIDPDSPEIPLRGHRWRRWKPKAAPKKRVPTRARLPKR